MIMVPHIYFRSVVQLLNALNPSRIASPLICVVFVEVERNSMEINGTFHFPKGKQYSPVISLQ